MFYLLLKLVFAFSKFQLLKRFINNKNAIFIIFFLVITTDKITNN